MDLPKAPQVLTQKLIQERLADQIQNIERVLPTRELDSAAARRLFSLPVHFVDGPTTVEYPFMLASVSKLAVMLIQAEALGKLPHEGIEAPMEVISSLLERKPERILTEKAYSGLAEVLREDLSELKLLKQAQKEQTEEPAQILANAKKKAEAYLAQTPIFLTGTELAYLALTLSSNSATRLVKDLSSTDEIRAKLAILVPRYEMLATLENFAYWLQPAPNVGYISEFSALLSSYITKLLKDETTPEENVVIESMTNNPEDFEFDFTHSSLGQELIDKGWKIIEKTGYYPCVYWVASLAQDWPMHMVLATVVCCYNPQTGQQLTFDHNMIIAVADPKETQEFDTPQGKLAFPNEWGKDYASYALNVKKRFATLFRSECEAAVRARLLHSI